MLHTLQFLNEQWAAFTSTPRFIFLLFLQCSHRIREHLDSRRVLCGLLSGATWWPGVPRHSLPESSESVTSTPLRSVLSSGHTCPDGSWCLLPLLSLTARGVASCALNLVA